ncbi:Protein Y57G11C.20 [Aphelenchoides avenae]|nr:Protein Y57G11C.20 [Aphelenchus avenae]
MSYKQFFVYLPSNTPGEGNTTNCYRCQLPKKLEFNGTWQVGLHSISFPHSWPSIGAHKQQWIDIYLQGGGRVRISVPKGTYLTPEELETAINSVIQKEHPFKSPTSTLVNVTAENVAEHPGAPGPGDYLISTYGDTALYHQVLPHESETLEQAIQRIRSVVDNVGEYTHVVETGEGRGEYKSVRLDYMPVQSRFIINFDHHEVAHVTMSEQLYYVLGFKLGARIRDGDMATYPPDMHGGISTIAVYTNIVEPMIVGDTTASVLRMVTVTGKPGQNIEKIYETPIYSKVLDREVTNILIELRTLDNRPVLFTSGNVMCTLIFRKVSLI